MIQLVDDRLRQVLQRDEIDDVVVLVEVAFHFDGRPIVMAVDPLALVALIGDKVPRAEDEIVLGHTDLEPRRWHGGQILVLDGSGKPLCRRAGRLGSSDQPDACEVSGTGIVPSRSAAYKAAVTRSAVVPGLSLRPGSRSHSSNSVHIQSPS